jgi:hypothetical protein
MGDRSMAQNTKDLPKISLDGKWFPCQSAGEFGFLGDRFLCDLATSTGQPPKKLLVRPLRWFQDKGSSGGFSSALEIDKLSTEVAVVLRPFAVKTYDYAIPTTEGKFRREERQFLQQDITGLIPLRDAILSKYEDATGGVIPNQLTAQLDQLATAKSLQELQDRAEAIAEDWSLPIEDSVEVRVTPIATIATSSPTAKVSKSPMRLHQDTKSWLGWFVSSLLANLLLVTLVILFASLSLFMKMGTPAGSDILPIININNNPNDATPMPVSSAGDSTIQFSSYFPARGTSSEKVLVSLKQLYPDKILVPKDGEAEHDQLLSEHLDLAVKSIKNADMVMKLIGLLNNEHSVRFNNYSPDSDDLGLKSIIANGGLYKITSPADKVQHGALLRTNSIERILAVAGMNTQSDARVLLESLKVATHEYASIKDAVTIMGNRPAFILRVEPTAKVHAAVRNNLLNRLGTPVFVPRPVFELFDAVDPAAGTGGGVARYSLKLDRKCNWRLVSSEDRRKTDYANNPTNHKMKWLSFAANQEIVWTTLPVLRQSGRTASVATFNISIAVADKAVVFRNQSILTGESRNEVLKQARGYLDSLGFKNVAIEDALSVRQQQDRFTGALLYNYLADQAAREDLEIMSLEDFERARASEDNNISNPK